MVSEKVLHFQNKNRDLSQLAKQVETQLQSEGYKTQSTMAPLGMVIQAQPNQPNIIGRERAVTIMIAGQPNDFTVQIGMGRWTQNTIMLPVLFLAIGVPEMRWARQAQNKIAEEITQWT
jgi:hypothetical protein